MKIIASALVLGLAFAISPAVHAQSTKKDLVARIVTAQQAAIEDIGRSVAMNTAQQVLQAAGEAVSQAPQARQEALAKTVQDDVKKFHDEIEPLLKASAGKVAPNAVGSLLEQKMSEEELRQVVAWLESPVSRKYQLLSSEMEAALAQQLVADSRGAVEPKLKALESTIRSRLEAAGGSSAPAARPAAPKAPAKKN